MTSGVCPCIGHNLADRYFGRRKLGGSNRCWQGRFRCATARSHRLVCCVRGRRKPRRERVRINTNVGCLFQSLPRTGRKCNRFTAQQLVDVDDLGHLDSALGRNTRREPADELRLRALVPGRILSGPDQGQGIHLTVRRLGPNAGSAPPRPNHDHDQQHADAAEEYRAAQCHCAESFNISFLTGSRILWQRLGARSQNSAERRYSLAPAHGDLFALTRARLCAQT